MKSLLLLPSLLIICAGQARADDQPRKDSLGRDYYLYTPAKIDPKKTYWLVVGVHGAGGQGKDAAGISAWAKRGDCIVVGPSFPDGFQGLSEQTDEQLVKLFESLQKQYTLHPKMFLYGFSGGAQFTHRFMMRYPELIAGCSSHSAGSWATGDPYMTINPKAAGIPLVISCGEKDIDKAWPDAPLNRCEWAKAFEKALTDAGFCFDARYWPNTGHAATPGVATMTEECYRFATNVIPGHEAAVAEIKKLIAEGKTPAAKTAFAKAKAAIPGTSSRLAKSIAARETKDLDALAKQFGADKTN